MSSSYPGFSIYTTLRVQYLLLILHIRRIKLTTLNDFATRLRVPHCSFKIKGSDVNWGLADVLRLAIACNSLYYWTSSSTLQGYEAQIFSPQSRLWFYCSGPLHPIIWLVHTEPLVDLHCMSFCTACRFALHVDLHCMSFCTACRFALHVVLHCMSICTACRFALHVDLHCLSIWVDTNSSETRKVRRDPYLSQCRMCLARVAHWKLQYILIYLTP